MAQADIEQVRTWVALARNGDPEAIGSIYEYYSDRIYSYAYSKLGDPAEAEDVTQQVFLKMIEKLDGFEWQGPGFASWLFRIAHNQIIDTVRRHSRHPQVPMDVLGSLPSTDGIDPPKYAERADFLYQLRTAMLKLSDLQAQVITLKYAAELSNSEVAEVMSRSKNAVNSLHYEALKNLEKHLTQSGYFP